MRNKLVSSSPSEDNRIVGSLTNPSKRQEWSAGVGLLLWFLLTALLSYLLSSFFEDNINTVSVCFVFLIVALYALHKRHDFVTLIYRGYMFVRRPISHDSLREVIDNPVWLRSDDTPLFVLHEDPGPILHSDAWRYCEWFLARRKRLVVFFSLGLRRDLNWIDMLYVFLVRELARKGAECWILIHPEGASRSVDRDVADQSMATMRRCIERICNGLPVQVVYSPKFASKLRKNDFGVNNLRGFADFVYFELLSALAEIAESAARHHEQFSIAIGRRAENICTTSEAEIALGHLENQLRCSKYKTMAELMLQRELGANSRLREAIQSGQIRKIRREFKRLEHVIANPFERRRISNLVGNIADTVVLYQRQLKGSPILLINWEYGAESWRNAIKKAQPNKLQVWQICGTTLRTQYGDPVPVYEKELSLNLRDDMVEVYDRITSKKEVYKDGPLYDVIRLISNDIECETYEKFLVSRKQLASKDKIFLEEVVQALETLPCVGSMKASKFKARKSEESSSKNLSTAEKIECDLFEVDAWMAACVLRCCAEKYGLVG